jgi:RNA polymerase sigma-70 factor (ECF subfamily)
VSASKVVRIFPRRRARARATSVEAGTRDRELVERVARGDTSAHRKIFDLYYGRVLAFVRRRLGDDSLCEEVTSDVFFEIWRSAGTFRGESEVHSWIFGIAHFKTLSARRRQGQLKRAAVIPTDNDVMQNYAEAEDLDQTIESRDELRRLMRALQSLPEGQREVVRLAFIEGRSYQEIADELGTTEGNVKTRVNRARARLRTSLRRKPGGDMA